MYPHMARQTPKDETGEGEEYELTPTDERLYDLEADSKVVGWRTESFEALGIEPFRAVVLAIRRDVDRVDVERLVKAGAPSELISSILL